MNLSVLYQRSVNSKEGDEREIEAIQKAGFNLSFHRNSPTVKDSIVVGRYSVVPFYRELEEDLVLSGSKLIHNFAGHRYIATGDYLSDLGWDITPRVISAVMPSGVEHCSGKPPSVRFVRVDV